jgi:hypothetical protein
VDYIRHEYLGTVRPYYDAPDVEVPVQWYFVDPKRAWVPQPNCFNDARDYVPKYRPFVGMTRRWKFNAAGNTKAFTGVKACGSPANWLNGVSIESDEPCECEACVCAPRQEVPAGAIDGTNRAYTLAEVPLSAQSVLLFVDGVAQTQGVNYSISGVNIYMAADSVLKVGNNILAKYEVPGG